MSDPTISGLINIVGTFKINSIQSVHQTGGPNAFSAVLDIYSSSTVNDGPVNHIRVVFWDKTLMPNNARPEIKADTDGKFLEVPQPDSAFPAWYSTCFGLPANSYFVTYTLSDDGNTAMLQPSVPTMNQPHQIGQADGPHAPEA